MAENNEMILEISIKSTFSGDNLASNIQISNRFYQQQKEDIQDSSFEPQAFFQQNITNANETFQHYEKKIPLDTI